MNISSTRKLLSILSMASLLALNTTFATAEMAVPEPCGEGTPCEESDAASDAVAVDEISYEDLKRLIESKDEAIVLLDTREASLFDQGHIPGASSFPLSKINEELSRALLSKDQNIIVYCYSRTCNVSRNAAIKLLSYGLSVKNYKGGVEEWVAKGNELEKSPQP